PETVRTDLLRTLLKLEIDYRTRAGQPTDPAELRSRVAALGAWASSVLDDLGNGPTLILDVTEGTHTGEQFRAAPPLTLVVGRSDGDHFALTRDPFLSRSHFEVEVRPGTGGSLSVRLRQVRGQLTRVNGRTVQDVELRDGDTIKAGRSTIRVRLELPP